MSRVNGLNPNLRTYYAISEGYAAYATPQDMFSLINPAGSNVLVIPRIHSLLAQSTAATLLKFYWRRRSAINTGGTPTDITPVPYDSGNPIAPQAIARLYGAAPTTSGAAPIVNYLQLSTAVTTAAPANVNSSGGSYGWALNNSDFAHPLILRPGEELALNLAGAALPAGFTSVAQVSWMEKPLD